MLVNADSRWIPVRDGSVQLIVTSPPYYNAREEYSSWSTYEDYLRDMAVVWSECYRVLCDGGRIAVNVPMGYGRPGSGGYITIGMDITRQLQAEHFELRGHVVWNKVEGAANVAALLGTAWGTWKSASNPSIRDSFELIIVAHKGNASRCKGGNTIDDETFLHATRGVWNIPPSDSPSRWHPAPFPAEIPRRLIELYSFKGDTVLDPFVGSGTTVFVANKLGRVGIGIDRKWSYLERVRCEVALQEGDWELSQQLARRVAAQGAQPLEELPMFAEM